MSPIGLVANLLDFWSASSTGDDDEERALDVERDSTAPFLKGSKKRFRAPGQFMHYIFCSFDHTYLFVLLAGDANHEFQQRKGVRHLTSCWSATGHSVRYLLKRSKRECTTHFTTEIDE